MYTRDHYNEVFAMPIQSYDFLKIGAKYFDQTVASKCQNKAY